MSNRVKDESGAHAFSLINKATGECLRHPPEDLQQVMVSFKPVCISGWRCIGPIPEWSYPGSDSEDE